MKFLLTLLALTSLVSAQTTYRFTTITGGVTSFNTTTLNADVIVNGTTNKVFTSTEKTKLAGIDLTGYALSVDVATLLADKSDIGHTHTFASLTSKPTTISGYGITDAPTGSGTSTGTNTGDNAVNSNYISDYRAANFIAGTNYLAPNGSAASLTGTFPGNIGGNAATATALAMSGGATMSGSSGAATITASGTNQNIMLTPSGTGKTVLVQNNAILSTSSGNLKIQSFNGDIALGNADAAAFGSTGITLGGTAGVLAFTNWAFYYGTKDTGLERSSAGTIATNNGTLGGTGNLLVRGTTTATGGLILPTEKTPASATATGTKGTICWDSSYIYVCTANNTWKRTAITTW